MTSLDDALMYLGKRNRMSDGTIGSPGKISSESFVIVRLSVTQAVMICG